MLFGTDTLIVAAKAVTPIIPKGIDAIRSWRRIRGKINQLNELDAPFRRQAIKIDNRQDVGNISHSEDVFYGPVAHMTPAGIVQWQFMLRL